MVKSFKVPHRISKNGNAYVPYKGWKPEDDDKKQEIMNTMRNILLGIIILFLFSLVIMYKTNN